MTSKGLIGLVIGACAATVFNVLSVTTPQDKEIRRLKTTLENVQRDSKVFMVYDINAGGRDCRVVKTSGGQNYIFVNDNGHYTPSEDYFKKQEEALRAQSDTQLRNEREFYVRINEALISGDFK